MDYIINTRLLSNPLNWFSIGAMLLLVGFGALAIYSRFHASTIAASPDNPSAAFATEGTSSNG